MEYSIEEKMNMSVERLRQEQNAEFLNELSENAEVVHRSSWAIIIKDGRYRYKMYYSDNLGRIKREIVMLQLMGQVPIQFLCDNLETYYSKEDVFGLEDIAPNDNDCTIAEQVDYWCTKWNQRKDFAICARKIWQSEMVPYMVNMLTLYGEDAEKHLEYLHSLQEEVFIHGGFTLDNIKKSGEKLVILDFETTFLGPKLWDKTIFVYSLIEHGYMELGMKLFEKFQCTKQMLACIAAVHLAIATSEEKVNFTPRKMAYDFIKDI